MPEAYRSYLIMYQGAVKGHSQDMVHTEGHQQDPHLQFQQEELKVETVPFIDAARQMVCRQGSC
jgi:hypothetical protein